MVPIVASGADFLVGFHPTTHWRIDMSRQAKISWLIEWVMIDTTLSPKTVKRELSRLTNRQLYRIMRKCLGLR